MTDIMKKPADAKWTDEQWEAIACDGSNILVAAAAGSGKTAVLVERIIRKISDPARPVDVDRLLVATFTKAAAAEMKHRIRQALEEELERSTGAAALHLRRQIALIHRAPITTIHSFCLELIQRHAQALELDPSFRVAQETEIELIRQDVLEDLFETYYAEQEDHSPFWELVEAYGGDRGDDELYALVEKLYDFSRSHPWPEHWLDEQVKRFAKASSENEQLDLWLCSLLEHVVLKLSGAADQLNAALQLCDEPAGPDVYEETFREDAAMISSFIEIAKRGDWNALVERFQTATFSRLKAARGDDYDPDLIERAKQLRSDARKTIDELKVELFGRTAEEYADELTHTAPVIQMLVQLVHDFARRFEQAKRAKQLVDFNDLEHYALRVLLAPEAEPGELIPSVYALEYRAQFTEILLDEYQDTNRVQESIVALIAQKEPGNRFMVGDVKQSIYRFRLAEPELFMEKYMNFAERDQSGVRIDLARNFRSRKQVIDGVNFVFRQIMQQPVGEMSYDERAALVCGASFPPADEQAASVDVLLIDRSDRDSDDDLSETDAASANTEVLTPDDLEAVQLEARLIARQIASLTGLDGSRPMQIADPKTGELREVTYRDFVILLRATRDWAPVMMEEFQAYGIPAYADVDSGYFASGEVEMMLSLLKVIDNPYQDIPFAAVLRSPIVQLTAEQMAQIRLADRKSSFYDAALKYVALEAGGQPALQNRLKTFLNMLGEWRWEASQSGSLSELIWHIYRQTGLVEIVGGFPGGSQRQANLLALYDRARQYEATSFRGLFRFLRFIERLRERGGDLGEARALSEQEDVVRIMSIHKSKGLEFPIVYVAGIGKMFNRMDLYRPFLLHKDLGFGPKIVDVEQRISYPSLPYLAIRRRLEMELLAEEMRVLYVAMTRAKEKLIFVGTSRRLNKQLADWCTVLSSDAPELPDHLLASARSYLDWIGPALIRHDDAERLRAMAGQDGNARLLDGSRWNVQVISSQDQVFAEAAAGKEPLNEETLKAIRRAEPLAGYTHSEHAELVAQRLSWSYGHQAATELFTKTSVSELKRMEEMRHAALFEGDDEWTPAELLQDTFTVKKELLKRPRFMTEKKMTPAERGTAYHLVMQHLDLRKIYTEELLDEALDQLVLTERISEEQRREVAAETLLAFFNSPLAERVRQAAKIYRELPFSYALPADEVYAGQANISEETILIQGVIDCLFQDEYGSWVLLDYKTDSLYGKELQDIRDRYELQIQLYARAISDIWKRPITEKYLFLFDGAHLLQM